MLIGGISWVCERERRKREEGDQGKIASGPSPSLCPSAIRQEEKEREVGVDG
jgi:hypothetical protein